MRSLISAVWKWLSFVTLVRSQTLPYSPTTILLPSTSSANTDIVYVFLEASEGSSQFAALNISSTIYSSDISLQTLTTSLPFTGDQNTAHVASISPRGEISVYTGSCSTSSASELWIFTPELDGINGNGTWATAELSTASDVSLEDMPGANFLSGALSFATMGNATASERSLYIFGGLCPGTNSTVSTWQSDANYSKQMLRLEPSRTSATTLYELDVTSTNGGPIAEAGFTMTGLTPTYSTNSDIQTQSQNFLSLGGMTATAFVNMSQVAIWSLPEESWSFVTVSEQITNAHTELSVKDSLTSIDSRSGHTAVLTEDGSKVIVFGGWVGDVSQAADPQLLVLHLGAGYGGIGDWEWSIPSLQPSGVGIFGHGAVMLPGNVMMVLGGFNISTSSSKRDTASDAQTLFFNATSMTWVSDYTNPAFVAASSTSTTSDSTLKTSQIGFGVGLGLGLPLLLFTIFAIVWLRQRRQRRRGSYYQEKHVSSSTIGHPHDLRYLSIGGGNLYTPDMSEQQSPTFPFHQGRWNSPRTQMLPGNYPDDFMGYEDYHGGIQTLGSSGAPPIRQVFEQPLRMIPRKPVRSGAQGQYQATPTFDFSLPRGHVKNNSFGTAGQIHPIYEVDENIDSSSSVNVGVALALGEEHGSQAVRSPRSPDRLSDPFKDPPANPYGMSMQEVAHAPSLLTVDNSAQEREREIQTWVSDWAAAGALINSQARSRHAIGRVSPTRWAGGPPQSNPAQLLSAESSSVSGDPSLRPSTDDSVRTHSNLSEGTLSVSLSRSGSGSQGARSSLLDFINHTFSGITNGPLFEGPLLGPRQLAKQASADSEATFATARTSFPSIQVEGETLLAQPEEHGYDEPAYISPSMPTRQATEVLPSSPSKHKPIARRGWLGSLRKALTNDPGTSFSYTPTAQRDISPVRVDPAYGPPRRATSDGATLWRRKQGKDDWEDSAADQYPGRRAGSMTVQVTGGQPSRAPGKEDEEWDIEKAVENRVVQVMFTVPREKLRVVNHDMDAERSEVGSLKSKTGSLDSAGRGSDVGQIVALYTGRDRGEGAAEPEVEADIADRGKESEKKKLGGEKLGAASTLPKTRAMEEKRETWWKGNRQLSTDLTDQVHRDEQTEQESRSESLTSAEEDASSRRLMPLAPPAKGKGKVSDLINRLEKKSAESLRS